MSYFATKFYKVKRVAIWSANTGLFKRMGLNNVTAVVSFD